MAENFNLMKDESGSYLENDKTAVYIERGSQKIA
jgi:hypothetical protein